MLFDNVPVPEKMTPARSRAQYRENHPDRVTKSRARYRENHPDRVAKSKIKYKHDHSKWQTDTKYLARGFVAYDGEGISDPDGSHRYVMLAVKSDTGDNDYLADPCGISTRACLDFILAAGERNPGAIHVIYGGSYDVNMILRDVPKRLVARLVGNQSSFVVWNGFRMMYRQGKSFYVCRVDLNGGKIGKGVTMYDVVSFFQCAFVKACDQYLGGRFKHRDLIVSNKALRSGFTDADIPEVRRYNDAELTNLLLLVRELRERLNKVGLRPRRWDGPGAVAAALLMREGVKTHIGTVPEGVSTASRYAYAGGRFEVIKFGHVEDPAFEYDINSAYPSAMVGLPSLADGWWEHIEGDPGPADFCLYHVKYDGTRLDLPGAFFRRDKNGTICYPLHVTGWYWSPEVVTGRDYCARGYGSMVVLEAWRFNPTSSEKPFRFVEGLYNKRRALKKAGDGAHVGLKLGINSLYGKTAQQIGWSLRDDGTPRLPPFHCLEWAGYTTAWCRAHVLAACLDNLESVIAFETDAMFVTEPLPVKVGSGLGEWELTEFTSLTYATSGVYFGTKTDGEVVKTRGVDVGQLDRDDVVARMGERSAADRAATVTITRFIGARLALAQDWGKWRRWVTMTKRIVLEPTGKRGAYGNGFTLGVWNPTLCPFMDDAHSHEFPLEWVSENPEMDELTSMRREEEDYER